MAKKFDLQKLADRAHQIAMREGWEKDWSNGGCYLHLEASEFIESLRGKGGSPPAEEACDVLFALFTILGHYNIPVSEVLKNLDKKMQGFEPDARSS